VVERQPTLTSKAPDRPHEVVAAAAELVVDVAGAGASVSEDDGGALAGGGVAGLDAAG
jgi:hypothetical protein